MRSISVTSAQARWLYPALLSSSVFVSNSVPFGVIVLALSLVAAIAAGAVALLCPCCQRSAGPYHAVEEVAMLSPPDAPATTSDPPLAALSGSDGKPRPPHTPTGLSSLPASAPRAYYLDNLKTVLTAIVVVHHCVGAFSGVGSLGLSVGNYRTAWQVVTGSIQILDQAYFMSLFFFVSALFSPASLDRKGRRAFLADKVKRLGLPFLFYFFFLGPALTALNNLLAIGRPVTYEPNAGPAWFLCWLLVFNVAYVAVVDGGAAMSARPSLARMCAGGAALGAVQGVMMVFMPVFPFMPIFVGSLPFDVAFFVAGIVTARSGWLSDSPLFPEGELRWARRGVVAFTVVLVGALSALYASGGGVALLSTNACDAAPDRGVAGAPLTTIASLMGLAVACGPFAVCISFTALDVFHARVNFTTPALSWLSAQSYAVYLLHSVLVLPLTAAFILTVRAVQGQDAMRIWTDGGGAPVWDSPSCVFRGGSLALIGGFLAVTAASLALVYPLAGAVRKLPGVRDVL